jgi:hypothetical protein
MPSKLVLISGTLIFVVCAIACLCPPARASANVVVASYSNYRDALNFYWVFGEVKNTGNTPATNITINASFYDASYNFVNSSSIVIAGSYGSGKSIVLPPGAKAPFYMLVLPQSGTANFNHCGFAVTFAESLNKTVGFQIPVSFCERNQSGSVETISISGPIVSMVTSTIQEGVNFYATLYNSTGAVIGQGYMYKDMNLRPGEAVAFNFQVATFYPAQAANFTVTVQSANYSLGAESNGAVTVIPELQPSHILPLFTAASLLITLLARKKNNP